MTADDRECYSQIQLLVELQRSISALCCHNLTQHSYDFVLKSSDLPYEVRSFGIGCA